MDPSEAYVPARGFQDSPLQDGDSTTTPEGIGVEVVGYDIGNNVLKVKVTNPSSLPFDQPAVVSIVDPANSVTTFDASVTPTHTFVATAHDPDVGSINGAGIHFVTFDFYRIGDETPFNLAGSISGPPYQITVDFTTWDPASSYDQAYVVVARARSLSGYWNETGTFFMVDY